MSWAQPLNLKGKVKGFLQKLRKVAILVDEARLEPFWEVKMAAQSPAKLSVFGRRAGSSEAAQVWKVRGQP